VSVDWYKVFTL